jgi:hypothetical protein
VDWLPCANLLMMNLIFIRFDYPNSTKIAVNPVLIPTLPLHIP